MAECPLRVIRGLAGQGRRSYLSVVTPKADNRGRRRCIAVNFSPKLLRRSHLPSSLYRKLQANSVTYDSKIWRCAWSR